MIDCRDGNFLQLLPPLPSSSWCFPTNPHLTPILDVCLFPQLLRPVCNIFTAILRFLLTFSLTCFSHNPFERKTLTWWKCSGFSNSLFFFFSLSLSFTLSRHRQHRLVLGNSKRGNSAAVMRQFAAECPFKFDTMGDCLTVSLPAAAAANALGTLEAGALWVNGEAAQPSVCSVSSDGAENRNPAVTVLRPQRVQVLQLEGPWDELTSRQCGEDERVQDQWKLFFFPFSYCQGVRWMPFYFFSRFLHPSTRTVFFASNVPTRSRTIVFSI